MEKKTILSIFRQKFISSLVTAEIHVPTVSCLSCVDGNQNTQKNRTDTEKNKHSPNAVSSR